MEISSLNIISFGMNFMLSSSRVLEMAKTSAVTRCVPTYVANNNAVRIIADG